MSDAPYSVLALDQSMTATGWAHWLKGEKAPSGDVFSLPSWGDDQGPQLDKFERWLKDMIWNRQVTHIAFEEPPDNFDHHETATQKMATWGLPTLIEKIAYQGGISADNRLMINISSWRSRFWGTERAPKAFTKSARRTWLKEKSIQACAERGWIIDNHNVADAHGILDFAMCCIDPIYDSRSGPLFRRAQLHRENEERELR